MNSLNPQPRAMSRPHNDEEFSALDNSLAISYDDEDWIYDDSTVQYSGGTITIGLNKPHTV